MFVDTLRSEPQMTTQNDAPWNISRMCRPGSLTYATQKKYHYDASAGAGVDVYVLASGVSTEHADFEGRASWGTNVAGGEDEDEHGLGTHLAGIVAGRKYGVAKRANIVAVKVADSSEAPEPKALLKGLTWTVEQAQASGRPSVVLIGTCGEKNADVDEAVRAAANEGLFIVVPAGHDNRDASGYSPAGSAGAFTVAGSTLTDKRWEVSNYGSAVDVFAPAVGILSAWKGSHRAVQTLSGTEQASAHVAGVAAYLLSTSTELTPATVGNAITSIATQDFLKDVPGGTKNLLAGTGYNSA